MNKKKTLPLHKRGDAVVTEFMHSDGKSLATTSFSDSVKLNISLYYVLTKSILVECDKVEPNTYWRELRWGEGH